MQAFIDAVEEVLGDRERYVHEYSYVGHYENRFAYEEALANKELQKIKDAQSFDVNHYFRMLSALTGNDFEEAIYNAGYLRYMLERYTGEITFERVLEKVQDDLSHVRSVSLKEKTTGRNCLLFLHPDADPITGREKADIRTVLNSERIKMYIQ